jgi:GNAT superfamily N-acetyltransferase
MAERDGRLKATRHIERRGKAGYFGMFAVDPGEQGRGIGEQVLAEAERIVRDEWRCRAINMSSGGRLHPRQQRPGWRRSVRLRGRMPAARGRASTCEPAR